MARSPYSVLLGLPTAAWGIFGYLLAAAVALWGLRGRRAALTAACGLLLFTGFAALSAVLWDFLFLPPRFTFAIRSVEDMIMFGMYFAVALGMGMLLALTRRRHPGEAT